MRIGVYTLGCKVNQYESAEIITALTCGGHEVTSLFSPVELCIINTCSVTSEADRKSRQMVARVHKQNPLAKVIIIGCSSENSRDAYAAKDNVVMISGTKDKTAQVMEAVAKLQGQDATSDKNLIDVTSDKNPMDITSDKNSIDVTSDKNSMDISSDKNPIDITSDNQNPIFCDFSDTGETAFLNTRARAYLKIQDGCNNFCSYCIVPYLRGRSQSRRIEDILVEASRLAASTQEIVLTGINISAFNDEGKGLAELLSALKVVPVRKRLGSLECNVITEDFLLKMKDADICDHFHLSLQSGSNRVLKLMNRHYSTDEYKKKVDLIRKHFPFAGITTDVIVGFPEETEQDFTETLQFVREIGFSDIHVFPYSKRSGTNASKMIQVDKAIISKRAESLTKVKQELKLDFLKRNLGRQLEVFIESSDGEYNEGYTSNYIKVYSKAPRHSFLVHSLVEIYNNNGIKGDLLNG